MSYSLKDLVIKHLLDMKIIKEGKIPTPEEKKFVCSHCECEFIADVYDTHYCQKDGAYVECPTCGKYITW